MRHNYSAYTEGCRCLICKSAKAEYQANRRRNAFLETAPLVEGITHGRFGYEERGCRCETCVDAYRTVRREFSRTKRARLRQVRELAG